MKTTPVSDPGRALTLLTIAHLVLLAMGFAFGIGDVLESPIDSSDEAIFDESLNLAMVIALTGLALLFLGAVVVGSVLLLLFKPFGAWCHLIGSVCQIALAPFLFSALGVVEFSQPAATVYVIESASWLTAGCLYGVAFFSSALHKTDAVPEIPATSSQPSQ